MNTNTKTISELDPLSNDGRVLDNDLLIISRYYEDQEQYKSHKIYTNQLKDCIAEDIIAEFDLSLSEIEKNIDILRETDKKFVKTINSLCADINGNINIDPILTDYAKKTELTSYATTSRVFDMLEDFDREKLDTIRMNKVGIGEITSIVNNINPNKIPTNQAVIDYVINNSSGGGSSSGVANIGVGSIIAFAGGGVIPENTLLCDGREVSKSDYESLYNVIGNTYGSAAEGKFKLPDLRNRFIEGCSTGDNIGTYLEAGLPNIIGNIGDLGLRSSIPSNTGALSASYRSTDHASYYSYNGYYINNIKIDASKSNSIYKDEYDTVQPPAVMMRYVIVHTALAGSVNNELNKKLDKTVFENTIVNYALTSNVNNELNKKLDKTVFENTIRGFIDGTTYKTTTISLKDKIEEKGKKYNLYTTNNNCLLFLGYEGRYGNSDVLSFYIGDNMIGSVQGSDRTDDCGGFTTPVKKGVTIRIQSTTTSYTSSCNIKIIEYKVN